MNPVSQGTDRHSSRARRNAPGGELPCARAGYTLIEILTLLVLLGILSALAAPRLDIHHYRIEGGMQAVSSVLLAAQRTAVQEQHNVVVAFDLAGGRLRIHSDADNDLLIGEGESVRYEPLAEGLQFGRGGAPSLFAGDAAVSFSLRQNGLPALVFTRNGAANEEGGLYLTSRRAASNARHARDTRALRIDRSTGRPTWFHLEGSTWKQEF